MEGINFDASTAGGDEINLFCNGTLAMAFPSEDGNPQLCGGIWGFGVFDNGDEAKIEASKTPKFKAGKALKDSLN